MDNKALAKGLTKISVVILVSAFLLFSVLTYILPTFAGSNTKIWTDKQDYSPTETVHVYGSGFVAGTEYLFKVIRPDGSVVTGDGSYNSWPTSYDYVTSDANGNLQYDYVLDGILGTYTVQVIYGENVLASTTFTDADIGLYDQCSNDLGTGYTSGDTGCRWTNGNLNKQNSLYYEGDATVQQLWLTGFEPGSTHNITLVYGTTKGGKHAYDFLTTWNWSEDWMTVADRCQSIDGCEAASAESELAIPHDPNGSGQFETGTRVFVMRGGTLTSATTPIIISGDYSGDSETEITIIFTVALDGAMCSTKGDVTTCGVALWFGAHISKTSDWLPFDGTTGATSISGSPYHVALAKFDGASVGQRDNQMQAGAVIPPKGSITLDKVTIPSGDPTSFSFSTTNLPSPTNPSLADVSSPVVWGNLSSGIYTITENVPAGWDLTGRSCTGASDSVISLITNGVQVNLSSGENITCTFTDTKRGIIIVEKQTIPDASSGSFTFTGDASGTISDNGQIVVSNLVPGTYTSTESDPTPTFALTNIVCNDSDSSGNVGTRTATFNLQAGETVKCTFTNTKQPTLTVNKVLIPSSDTGLFNLQIDSVTKAADVGDGGTTGAVIVSIGSHTVSETAGTGTSLSDYTSVISGDCASDGSVTLAAGDNKVCTITNTRKGHILVDKVTIPSGDSQSFEFNPSWSAVNFFLTDAETPHDSGVLLPGTYSVSENSVSGWTLVDTSCDDSSPVSAIDLAAGETVTCTFTNVKNPKITISPTATNEVGTPHTFTVTIGQQGSGGFVGIAGLYPTVIITPSPDSVTDNCASTGTNSSGQCTLIINSNSAGVFTAHAAVSVTIGGHIFNIETDGTGENSGNAVKTYVDASIALSPLESTNKVGQPHNITAFVTKNDGTGTSNAVGVTVVFSITSGTATFVGGDNDCVTDGTGHCSVQIISSSPGSNTIDATTTFLVGGVSLTRETDGNSGPLGSGPASKDYVNARITITPNQDTNEVEDSHDFIIKVEKDTGSGWTAVEGALVDVVITPPTFSFDKSDCNDGTAADGTCTATINSLEAGVFTAMARSQIMVDGVEFKLATNGIGENSGSAVKTYVDAKIILTPLNSTNNVGQAHTITATVMEDPGTGFVAASGELVTFTLLNNAAGATFVGGIDTCTTNSTGQCSIQIISSIPGNVDIHASVDVGVGGLTLHRETDGTHGSSGDAHKIYAAGKIIVVKQTLPDGSLQSFEFNPSWSAVNFFLTDGQQQDSGWLAPGTYSVSEIAISGWDLTSATCDDGSPVNDIDLSAGETVTCTFVNTQRGHLIVQKTTDPAADPTIFSITASGTGTITGGGAGSITDAIDQDYEVTPGTYNVAENVPAGWYMYSNDCVNVVVDPGETEYCTITNVKIKSLEVTKDAETEFTRTFGWTIIKSVVPDEWNMFRGDSGTSNYTIIVTKDQGTDSDWKVSGTISIYNPNLIAPLLATIDSVSDAVSGVGAMNVICPVSLPYNLTAGGTLVCTYSGDLPNGANRTNTATVTTSGLVPGGSDDADVIFTEPTSKVNDQINVDDTNGGSWLFGDSGSVSYTKTFTCDADEGSHENTATIRETGQNDSTSVTVNCYVLEVSKTANTFLDRTWHWTIDKIGNVTNLTLSPDQIVAVGYDIVVNATGSTDSNWMVNGTITIHNPAPIDATITSVSDIISGAGAVTVSCPVSLPYTLVAGGTLTCTYSYNLADASSRTNTVTATLQNTPSGTTDFSGVASVNFTNPVVNEIDECVNVSDTYLGNLGIVCKDQTPKTFSYSREIGPYNSTYCGTQLQINNTASFITIDTEETGNDDWSINVTIACVCSLTQGYWKTHSIYGPAAHPDATWYNITNGTVSGPDTPFFLSGKTYYQVLWTNPQGGNAYYILAHQYIAAELNSLKGAGMSPVVQAAFDDATNLFNTYTPAQIAALKGKTGNSLRSQFIYDAGILGAFNEGTLNPSGHCSD